MMADIIVFIQRWYFHDIFSFVIPLLAPAPAVWRCAHKTQLLSSGPGGVCPAYLPAVGAAVLA